MIAPGMMKTFDNESTLEKTCKDHKLKHDWYQTETYVNVAVMYKNLKREEVSVVFGVEDLEITIGEHRLLLNLHKAIVPENCSYKFSHNKIEVHLAKLVGTRWPALEKSEKKEAPKPVIRKEKNWDQFVKENVEEDDGPLAPFHHIYQQSDDDMRRAMMKSMQESGGTVLSTNWSEVSKSVVKRYD